MRSIASRRMVQWVGSLAPPEASFEAASRRLRTGELELPIIVWPLFLPASAPVFSGRRPPRAAYSAHHAWRGSSRPASGRGPRARLLRPRPDLRGIGPARDPDRPL